MKKIILTIFLITPLVLIFCIVFSLLFGTPWGKAYAFYTIKKYVSDEYVQDMIVERVVYDLEGGAYIGIVTPLENNDIEFSVYLHKDWTVWKDKYYLEYFSNELGVIPDENAKKIFGDDSRAYAVIEGEKIEAYEIQNLNEDTQLVNVVEKFDDKYRIGVSVKYEFDLEDYEAEAGRILEFISFVKTLEYEPSSICFNYQKQFVVDLSQKEYIEIDSINELKSYIEEEIKNH